MRVEHKTCSTICGTPFQVILNQNNLTGLAEWVREGQNMAQNAACAVNPMQNYWLRSLIEPPEWPKDTRNGPQTISPIDLSFFPGSLTNLGASRGLQSQKFCISTRPSLSHILTFPDPQLPKTNNNHRYNTHVTARYHCYTFPTIGFLIGRIIWSKKC